MRSWFDLTNIYYEKIYHYAVFIARYIHFNFIISANRVNIYISFGNFCQEKYSIKENKMFF